MSRRGGFKVGRRLLAFCRRLFSRRRCRGRQYLRVPPCPDDRNGGGATKLSASILSWARGLAQSLHLAKKTPKGHLAVYVDGGRRYVVPVGCFNHPLFGELLKETEEVYGFDHPGGITIPCPAARFERVAALAAGAGARLRY